MSRPMVVIWGAGKIGRGPIADMFQSSGWHLVFVRRSPDFIARMREAGSYHIIRAEAGKEPQTITVTDYEAYSTEQADALADALVRADLVVVPVMAPQLAQAAQQMVPGLQRRKAERPEAALDILPCANMVSSAEHFLQALRRAMPDELHYLDDRVGIVEALIRVGATDPPADQQAEEPALVYTRGPGVLHVDRDAFKGAIPDIPGLLLVHDPATQSMLKIWLGNMAHGYLAYRGWLQGHELISDCVNDPVVIQDVKSAMLESAGALVADGRMSEAEASERLEDFPRRADNPEYPDTVRRVAADPQRKLGRHDRFVGPLLLARKHNLPFGNLARGAASALRYAMPSDKEAMGIQQSIAQIGLRATIREVCGLLADEDDVIDHIVAQYRDLHSLQK